MISVHWEFAEWVQDLAALEARLNDVLENAVRNVAQDVAYSAKQTHSFQNRTGKLEQSIEAYPPKGSALDDTLEAVVVAGEEYAGFVESRMPFLAPAWQENDAQAGQRLEDALERAVTAVGMR